MQPAHAAYSAVVAGLKHYYIDISYLVLTMTIVRYHGTRWAVAAYAHLKHVHPTPQLMAEAHLYVRLTSQLMAGAHLYVHPTSQLTAGGGPICTPHLAADGRGTPLCTPYLTADGRGGPICTPHLATDGSPPADPASNRSNLRAT